MVAIESDQVFDGWVRSVVSKSDCVIRLVSCRPFGEEGMLEFVEMVSQSSVKDALRAVSAEPSIAYCNFSVIDIHRASGIVVAKRSPVCRAVSSVLGFCKGCALTIDSGKDRHSTWHVMLSGKASLNKLMAELRRKGIQATVTDAGDLVDNDLLTYEQEKALGVAAEKGYFGFPHGTSLKTLSEAFGICPSTLDEVLRRAESKIILNHISQARGTTGHGIK